MTGVMTPLTSLSDALTLNLEAASELVFKTSGQERLTINANGVLQVDDIIIGSERERGHIYGTMWNPPAVGKDAVLEVVGTGRGISTTGQGLYGLSIVMQDNGSVVNKAVTGAANNGSGLIRITCTGHTFATGDRVAVYSVGGVPNANGSWTITVINANTFDLQGSTFAGAYTSGGAATNRPYMLGIHVAVNPSLKRGSDAFGFLSGTAANADDANAYVASNGSGPSGAKATDAFYVSAPGPSVGPAWDHAFSCDAKVDIAALQFTGDLTGSSAEGVNAAMVDLGHATASGGGSAIRLPNNVMIRGRNAADSADVDLFKMNTSNWLEFSTALKFPNGGVLIMGASAGAGVNIGFDPANEKIGFWGATPILRPSSTGTSTGFTAGAGTGVKDDSTFTGAVGSTAYRISDIVKHLKNLGLIAP